MINMPEVKIGIVAVSRDCFPESLSIRRNMMHPIYTNVQSVSWKANSTWCRPWRM